MEGVAVGEFATLLSALGWRADDLLTLNTIYEGRFVSQQVLAGQAQATVDRFYVGRDCWYSVCPLAPVARGRGREGDVVGVYALWADLDVEKLELSACWDLIGDLSDKVGAQATVVSSGHGLHPYWRLGSPLRWERGDAGALGEAKRLLSGWGALVQQQARKFGGEADAVFDLARVLRVPGTLNLKGVSR